MDQPEPRDGVGRGADRVPLRMPWWLGFVCLATIALFFLWEEHEAHIRGALPWALLLACPLVHLFMHGGHGGHGGGAGGARREG